MGLKMGELEKLKLERFESAFQDAPRGQGSPLIDSPDILWWSWAIGPQEQATKLVLASRLARLGSEWERTNDAARNNQAGPRNNFAQEHPDEKQQR